MYLATIIFLVLNAVLSSNVSDLYPNYSLTIDPNKVLEWSENQALAYITTVRLFDYDHHIFQYRHYPCQFFYTDEIQLYSNNEITQECLFNTTTGDYVYNFQLHLDSRHVEPYILRNVAIQCNYKNCSLSLLNLTYIHIGWSKKGRENNPDCSFDTNQPYTILRTPYTISELIPLQCKSLLACNQSKLNLEQSLPSAIQLIYGSSYELEVPYCSLEKSLSHILDKHFAETNHLLQQLLELMQRGFGQTNKHEQDKMKEYIESISSTTTTTQNK